VRLKDFVPDIKKFGVVYQIPLNCGKSYIGESGRLWGTRKDDHVGYIKGNNVRDSAVLEHLLDCNNQYGHTHPGVP
jgi:hypothetical protein